MTFDSEIDSKDCKLGWKATVRTVIKGGALIPQTAANIFVLPVRECKMINFKWGEHYLVAGIVWIQQVDLVYLCMMSVCHREDTLSGTQCMQYAPVLEGIKNASCG